MANVKCEKCGSEFKSEHALKVHVGLQHSGKRNTVRRRKKASGRKRAARATRKGKFVCSVCGRSFKMAAHLARHRSAGHSRAKRKKAVRRAAGRAGASSGVNVNALSVRQLLALKREVDVRLSDIVQQMRKAKIRI